MPIFIGISPLVVIRLRPQKASAAQMFKMNTLALINGIVTGAAGIAALPVGM